VPAGAGGGTSNAWISSKLELSGEGKSASNASCLCHSSARRGEDLPVDSTEEPKPEGLRGGRGDPSPAPPPLSLDRNALERGRASSVALLENDASAGASSEGLRGGRGDPSPAPPPPGAVSPDTAFLERGNASFEDDASAGAPSSSLRLLRRPTPGKEGGGERKSADASCGAL